MATPDAFPPGTLSIRTAFASDQRGEDFGLGNLYRSFPVVPKADFQRPEKDLT